MSTPLLSRNGEALIKLRVWLNGARCAPQRLPFAIFFTIKTCVSRMRREDAVIAALFAGAILAVFVTLQAMTAVFGDIASSSDRHWIVSLMLNLVGYSTVFLPGFAVIEYVRRTELFERAGQKLMLEPALKLCILGSPDTIDDAHEETKQQSNSEKPEQSETRRGMILVGCFFGLQGAYLTWGVLQEKIMTRKYVDGLGNEGQFKDSQFLVFVNRILAFAIALLYIMFSRQPRHRAPLYKYSYCSLSNIMSSWCQYEALKFISFPTQVLAKASKVIPVMIMGRIISGKKYEYYEYLVAVLISLGMVLFLFGSQTSGNGKTSETTLSGLILLIGYMTSDSFTSNWQNKLFTTYKMSSVQMMCGVNLFSCLLTSASLLQQGTFYSSLVFMSQYPAFGYDCFVLSVCSAVGQLVIYYTISQFGAVVFIIIMTLRQAMAVILSCILYDHPISASGVLGVLVVFGAIFLKIYCGHRLRKAKTRPTSTAASPAVPLKQVSSSGNLASS